MAYNDPTVAISRELQMVSVDKEVDNSRLQQTSLIHSRICAVDTIV